MIRTYLHHFQKSPLLAFELVAGTFCITLLALASPLFVIQVLNRYITYGFDGTLFTLTAGVLLAIALQYGFRLIRSRMLSIVIGGAEYELIRRFYSVLGTAGYQSLNRLPLALRREIVINLRKVQAVFDTTFLTPLLDSPFSLLYLLTVYFLSPVLALVTVFWIALLLLAGWIAKKMSQKAIRRFEMADGKVRADFMELMEGLETMRMFGGVAGLQQHWQEHTRTLVRDRSDSTSEKERLQSLLLTGVALQSVCLYVVGAILVVRGELSIGALIGANILAGRACQSVTQLLGCLTIWQESKPAFKQLQQLFSLPVEQPEGTALKQYDGGLAFESLSFSHTGREEIISELSGVIAPGAIMVITGGNSAGKTTLIRLLAGLLEPVKGHVLVNGVRLDQIATPWWRQQLCYLPQDVVLLHQSIRDNIILSRSDIAEQELNEVVQAADLRRYLDKLPTGIMTPVVERGHGLPPGIIKRIGLARALAQNGSLLLFDEPTEALDNLGCRAVYDCLNRLARKKTIIIATNDAHIIQGAHWILDLDRKPARLVPGPQGGLR